MLKRLMGAAMVAALAGCGDGRSADVDADVAGRAAESGDALPASRFEVSVDTQRVTAPDSEVPPSENPDN